MNDKNLNDLKQHYADRFEEMNGEPHFEYYKWEIAAQFRPMMDDALSAADEALPEKLIKVVRLTEQTIDNQYELSFYALTDYARYAPQTVRDALKGLFADDGDDLTVRKEKYDAFLAVCDSLRETYAPESWRYRANMRLPMCLTAFYDPDHYYFYKPAQSKAFADCVCFMEDWGSSSKINLRAYYRMCNAVSESIANDPAFAALKERRQALSARPLHPDTAHHLETFDLIFCSATYNLFVGIPYNARSAAELRVSWENSEKAKNLAEKLEDASARLQQLEEVVSFFLRQFAPGKTIRHKTFGEGTVLRHINRKILEAQFASQPEPKCLQWNQMVQCGLLAFDETDAPLPKDQMLQMLKLEDVIRKNVENAEAALEPYKKYLED